MVFSIFTILKVHLALNFYHFILITFFQIAIFHALLYLLGKCVSSMVTSLVGFEMMKSAMIVTKIISDFLSNSEKQI